MEHELCRLDELVDGGAAKFEVGGRTLAVVRLGDAVYVIGDTCSHADYSLAEGEVFADTVELECPKHGSAFSLETGEPASFPATDPVPVYVTSIRDGAVWVEVPS